MCYTSNDLPNTNRRLEVAAPDGAVESEGASKGSVPGCHARETRSALLVPSVSIIFLGGVVEIAGVFDGDLVALLRLVLLIAVRGHGSCDTHGEL